MELAIENIAGNTISMGQVNFRPNKLNSQFIVTTSSNFHEGGRSLFIINFWLLTQCQTHTF